MVGPSRQPRIVWLRRAVSVGITLALVMSSLSVGPARAEAVSISGTVVDSNGAPLAGVTISLYNVGEPTTLTFERSVTTSADGRYSIPVSSTWCSYNLVASKPSNQSLADGFLYVPVFGGTVTSQDFVLRKANVTGSVKRENGNASPTATVTALPRFEQPAGFASATNNQNTSVYVRPDGSFRMAVPVGQYLLRADPPHSNPFGDSPSLSTPISIDSEDPDVSRVDDVPLVLRRPNVFGKLFIEGTETVVPRAYVSFTDENFNESSTVTASDGTFSMSLSAGTFTVRTYTSELSPDLALNDWSFAWTFSAPNTPADRVRFDVATPNFKGSIKTSNGSPVSNAHLFIESTGQMPSYPRGMVDQTGRFGYLLDPGGYVVVAAPPAPNSAGLASKSEYLTIEPGAVIERQFALGAEAARAYDMTRFAGDVPEPCGESQPYAYNQRVLAMDSDGTRTLVQLCEGPYGDLDKVALLDRADGRVITRVSLDADLATMSRDGSVLVWSGSSDNYWSGEYPVSIARETDWSPTTTQIPAASSGYGPVRPALSGDGSRIALMTRDSDGTNQVSVCDVAESGTIDCTDAPGVTIDDDQVDHLSLSASGTTLSMLRRVTVSTWRAEVHVRVGDEWLLQVGEWSADAAPSLSEDGARLVWMNPGRDSFSMRSRSAGENGEWSPTDVIVPMPTERFLGSPGQYEQFEVSGDGRNLFFVARVRDLVYGVTEWGSSSARRFGAAQLWRIPVDLPADPKLVSIDASTGLPLAGYMGFFGDIGSLRVSRDGSGFALGASAPVDDSGYVLAMRLFDGAERRRDLFAFEEGAKLSVATGSRTAVLSWPSVPGKDARYRVSRSPANGANPVTTSKTTVTLDGLSSATTYTVSVEVLRPDDSVGGTLSGEAKTSASRTRSLVAAAGDGGTFEFSWDPEPIAAACELRGDPVTAGLSAIKRSVAGLKSTVSGLAAGSTWDFQVFCTVGESTTSITDALRVTVASLKVESVTWTVPKVGRFAARDGDVSLTVKGESGRLGTATVNRVRSDGATDAFQVALTEDVSAPGTYRGTMPLAGTARVSGVVGRLSDNDANSATVTSDLPAVNVEGVVAVDISGPASVGWDLVLSSEDGSLVKGQPLTTSGPQVVTFRGLKPASNVRAVLRSADGVEVVSVKVADVVAGTKVSASLDAVPLVTMTFLALDEQSSPVSDLRIDVTVGSSVWQLVTGSDGRAVVTNFHSGRRMSVVGRPGDVFRESVVAIEPFAVPTTDAVVDVRVERRPTSTIEGTARREDGSALVYASVLVSQKLGDMTRQVSTVTDWYGTYESPSIYAGLPTTVTISPMQTASSTASLAPKAGTNILDFSISDPAVYMVPVKLYASGSPTPLSLDWRTAVHYAMSATVANRTLPVSALATDLPEGVEGGILAVAGAEGETLRICFDGFEAGDGRGCGSVVLPSSSSPVPTLEVYLTGTVQIEAMVRDSDGKPFDGAMRVWVSEPNGRNIVDGTVDGPRISVPIATTGPLRLTVRPVSADLWSFVASASFVVGADTGPTLTIPTDLVLERPGRFSTSSNVVVADRSTVSPGSYVDFRASWENGGADVENAVARIVIPSGTTLNMRSVMIGTTPVATSDVLVEDLGDNGSRATIALGDIRRSDVGTFRWRLLVDPNIEASAVVGDVSIGDGIFFDQLQPTAIPVSSVVLNVPAEPASTRFSVSGRAPSGSSVEVMVAGVPVGSATAMSNGAWTTVVDLPQRPDGHVYTLVARATTGAVTTVSDSVNVVLDTRSVKMTAVCVRQQDPQRSDGRRTCFDPGQGVAGFPFVYVPGQTLQVEVFTDAPDRVDSVTVWVGDSIAKGIKRSVAAPTNLGFPSGTSQFAFVADFNDNVVRGEISVELEARPVKPTVPQKPDARDAARYVDGRFVESNLAEVVNVVETPSGGSFTAKFDTPAGLDDTALQVNVTGSDVLPTAAEIAEMDSTGSPVWDLSMGTATITQLPGERQRMSTTVSFKVLVEDLEPGTMASSIRSSGIHALGIPPSVIFGLVEALEVTLKAVAKKGIEWTFNIATNADAGWKAWTSDGKYDSATILPSFFGPCLSDASRQKYMKLVEILYVHMFLADFMGALLALMGLAAAPPTFGLATVALWGIAFYGDYSIGKDFDRQAAKLKAEILEESAEADKDPNCRKKPKKTPPAGPKKGKKGSGPVAKPVWIYDPSGYTYEGSTAVRVTGVTATLLRAPDVGEDEDCPEVAAWMVVDMSPYGQTNPLTTDEDGRYGWDVPEGCWKVQFTKAGYRTSYSAALKVLPPHLDVNIEMIPLAPPSALGAVLVPGGVEVTFDRLMSAGATADSLELRTSPGGDLIATTVVAIDAVTGANGRSLSRKFRLLPYSALTAGASYAVKVATDASDFASTAVEKESSFTVNVPTTTTSSSSTVAPVTTPPTTVKPPTTTVPPTPTTVRPPTTTVPPTPTTVKPPTTTVPPTPTNVYRLNKSASRTAILKLGKISAPSGSKITMTVASTSSKICKVIGTSVRMLKVGTCKVTVTVVPKKGKTTRKLVTLKAVK